MGGLALFVLGTVLGGSLHVQSALAAVVMLYLAFICGAGYILWALLMKNNPVSRIAIFGFVNPVVNVLLSARAQRRTAVPLAVSGGAGVRVCWHLAGEQSPRQKGGQMTGPIFDTHAHYSARAFDADRYPPAGQPAR